MIVRNAPRNVIDSAAYLRVKRDPEPTSRAEHLKLIRSKMNNGYFSEALVYMKSHVPDDAIKLTINYMCEFTASMQTRNVLLIASESRRILGMIDKQVRDGTFDSIVELIERASTKSQNGLYTASRLWKGFGFNIDNTSLENTARFEKALVHVVGGYLQIGRADLAAESYGLFTYQSSRVNWSVFRHLDTLKKGSKEYESVFLLFRHLGLKKKAYEAYRAAQRKARQPELPLELR